MAKKLSHSPVDRNCLSYRRDMKICFGSRYFVDEMLSVAIFCPRKHSFFAM